MPEDLRPVLAEKIRSAAGPIKELPQGTVVLDDGIGIVGSHSRGQRADRN